MPAPDPDFRDAAIQQWDVTLSMDRGATAVVLFTNEDSTYDDVSLLQEQFELYIQNNSVTTQWFRGWLISVDPTYDANNNRLARCQFASVFAPLDRKPVNTHTFDPTGGTPVSGQSVLEELIGTYGSIDSSFYDFTNTTDTRFSKITISEDSLIHAARQIAQAAEQELFVDNLGVLKTEDYVVTPIVTPDISLLSYQVLRAAPQFSNEQGFSRLRIRGRYLSLEEQGTTSFFNSNVTVELAQASDSVLVTISLGISEVEMVNATYTSSTPGITVELEQALANGRALVRATKSPDGFDAGETTFNVTISGPQFWAIEYLSTSVQQTTNVKARAHATLKAWRMMDQVANREFTTWTWRSPKEADSPEEARIDVVGDDSALVTEFGVRWQEVDNPYIPSTTIAQDVGDRVFQEFKQGRQVWILDIMYNDAIRLNQSIEFSTQSLLITGVVRQISISYVAANSQLTMKIHVEELSRT